MGSEFWLIRQDDHARLAGDLLPHFGNDHFARPKSPEQMLIAVAEHDAGWPMHDDCPTLNDAGLPRDVFETDGPAAHGIWLQSARHGVELNPYIGLLVTLHQFHLSAQNVQQTTPPAHPAPFQVDQLRRQFETNKFQHVMIEMIESLRGQLGLTTDRPLRLGLADGWTTPAEDLLRSDFRLLQALDGLSLAVCCTRPPRARIGPMHEFAGSPEMFLTVDRPQPERLLVSPWPFAKANVRVEMPYRAVPARPYVDGEDLQSIYAEAEPQRFNVELLPG